MFHIIYSFNTNEDVTKIIGCEHFKNSQENVSNGVYFSTVTSLPRTDCKSTINRLHKKFFMENVPKTNCLKRTFVKACKNLLIKCSPAGHSPQFYQKQSSH